MSLKTWKNKYYPVDAKDAAGSDKEALEHSLRKWEGLRAYILEDHGVTRILHVIMDVHHRFRINAVSCALCFRHLGESLNDDANCKTCPLFLMRRKRPCDELSEGEITTPYESFTFSGNPEPMIQLLKQALDREETNENSTTVSNHPKRHQTDPHG